MIKSKNLAFLVLFTISIYSMTYDANAFDHTTIGSPTCQSWVKDKKTTNEKENITWLTGYFSGLSAVFSVENEVDLLKDADIKDLFNWTDDYCKKFPNGNISKPAEIYVLDLVKQKMPNRQ